MRCTRQSLFVAGLTVAILSGCGGGHSSSPSKSELSAFPLSEDPVTGFSSVWPGAGGSDGEYVFHMDYDPDTVLSLFDHDIQFEYGMNVGVCWPELHIWNQRSRDWKRAWHANLHCVRVPPAVRGVFSASAAGMGAADLVIEPALKFRIRSGDIADANAQMLHLSSTYESVPLGANVRPICMTWDGEHVWMEEKYWTDEGANQDSLVLLDRSGCAIRRVVSPPLMARANLKAMAWTPFGLAAASFPGPLLTVFDSTLNEINHFTLTWRPDPNAGMAYFDERLWLLTYSGQFIAIDLEASMHEARAIFTDSVPLPQGFATSVRLGWNGTSFILAGTSIVGDSGVWGVTPEGQTLFVLPLPHEFLDMAWDGEAMWMIHAGHGRLKTGKHVLSRFSLD